MATQILTDEVCEQSLVLHERGTTVDELAERVGVHPRTMMLGIKFAKARRRRLASCTHPQQST